MTSNSPSARTRLVQTALCCIATSAVFLYWLHSLDRSFRVTAVGYLIAMPVLLLFAGRTMIRLLRMRPRAEFTFPLEVVLGFSVVTPAVFVLDAFTSLPTIACWACVGIVTLTGYGLAWFRPAAPPADDTWPLESPSPSPVWWGPLAVVLALAAATLWTEELRPYASRSEQTVIFRPWADTLVHAQITGLMSTDQSMFTLGDPDMAGRRLPVYHYGSYVYAAAVEAMAGVSGMDAVTAFWIPFGVLLLGLAAYALAAEWSGDVAGLAAMAAVLLLPDASKHAIPVRWYSFHWLLAVSPGLMYGIAGGAAALTLIIRAHGTRRNDRMLWTGLALALSTLAIKAQIFVAVVPLLVLWTVWFGNNWTRRRRWRVTIALIVVGVVGLAVPEMLQVGPVLLPSLHDPVNRMYWSRVSGSIAPGFWHDLLVVPKPALPRQALLLPLELVVAPLGILTVVVPGLLALKARRQTLRPTDAVPVIAFGMHVLLSMVPGPNNRGAVDEIWHRPFVWMVFVLLVWTAVQLAPWVAGWRKQFGLAVASACLLVVPMHLGRTIQRLQMPEFYDLPFPTGLVDAAEFLRTHSAVSDVVQGDPASKDAPVLRSLPRLGALAERRTYLGRSPTFWLEYYASSPAVAEAKQREAALGRLRAATTHESFDAMAAKLGIGWFVFSPDDRPAWLVGTHAFESQGYIVHRVSDAMPLQ